MEPAGEGRHGGAREEEEEGEEERGGAASSGDSEPEPETTASRARRVSFADAFGLDLVSVKEFSSRAVSAASVAADDDDDAAAAVEPGGPDPEEYFLCSQFSVPASAAELLAKLQAQRCELECVELLPGTTTLRGTVRVLNLSYDKRVRVRTTLDGWGTHFDLPASFIPGSSDGETDRFAFSLELSPPVPPEGVRVEFCLRYETPLGTFWANNSGMNYVLFCQQRGCRDGKGRQCEDTSFRSKRSCLKYNSKEKSTEANTPVISAEATDVPLSKQEVEVSKKTEEPAPNPDGFQDDSCQKPSVESGRNPSRRSRRRAARRARLQERSHRAAAAGREGSPAQDNRDMDGQADADAGRSPSEVSELPHEGACMMWDWSQRRRTKAHDEFSPQAGTEGPLPPLRFAADAGAALAGPGEDTHGLSGPATDTFGSVEDGRASAYTTAREEGAPQGAFWDLGAPQGAFWDSPALQGTLWDSDTPQGTLMDSTAPQGAFWDSPALQGTLWDSDTPQGAAWDLDALQKSAVSLSDMASGPESRGSPQTGEGDASTQTRAAADISASVRDSLDDDITGGKDGDRRHSHPLSGDGGGTDALQDSDLLWPQSDRGGGKFKFETFVAPLYHQAFHEARPDSRDVSRGLWAGGPASDDSDDEGQVGSADSCSRLTVMATAQPLFPFGTYAPPVHPLGRSGEILESAPDKSLGTDTRAPKQEQLVYGQDNAAQPLLETSGAGAEITAHSGVHQAAEGGAEAVSGDDVHQAAEGGAEVVSGDDVPHAAEGGAEAVSGDDVHQAAEGGAEVVSGDDVPHAAEIGIQDEECREHSFTDKAVEGVHILEEVGTKTDATAMIATLALSNTNATEGPPGGACSGFTLLPVSARTETEDKPYELGGGLVTYTDGFGEVGGNFSEGEGQEVREKQTKKEEESRRNEGDRGKMAEISVGSEKEIADFTGGGTEGMWMENKVSLDESQMVSAEKEEEFSKTEAVLVENDRPCGEYLIKNEDLDDEVSVEDAGPIKDVLVENVDDEVLMEDEEIDKNVSVENKDVLVDTEDVDDEVFVEDEELEKNILLENKNLYSDNVKENEDLDNEELSVEDAELVKNVSAEHEDVENDEGSVEDEDLSGDNLNENLDNEELPVDDAELVKDVSVEQDIDNDERSVEEETDKYASVTDVELDRDQRSVENKDLYGENLTESEGVNDDRFSVENKDLDSKVSLKDEDLDEEALSMENGDGIHEAGEGAAASKDLYEVKSESSAGKKDDLYGQGEVFFIERKDEHHGGENEREDLDEEVGVVFRGLGLDPCKDLKAEALGDEDVHLHTDRAAAGGETEGDVTEAGEVFKEEGKRSVDGEDPDREAEEDNVSTDSLTDEEMELHMRSVKSAIGPPLGRAALGSSGAMPGGGAGGKRPSVSRARVRPTALSPISESPNEDGDAAEEPGLPPAETAGDGGAATAAPPAEAVENAAGSYLSSWADAFWASHLGRTFLYVLLCALFFFTAYHYDFLACFALYLFSVFWLCFHGDKQRLQEANRGK
ncbi:uncharacterized protein LOC118218719 isoform X2 [Anguilla anguilla]|uniref:uncharacterized protein LOC118218719 isoform X2 n=1 Tax=Anguilla anguilla TaxID=7936 RepID=UPI0015B04826|nr:uncharacterized protein LOC118218719 isoform X2 [Anguilla anguilla]